MEENTIESFKDFHQIIHDLGPKQARIFRGLSNVDYPLIPSICRLNFSPVQLRRIEKNLFKKFKESAVAYIEKVPSNDWEWLALTQHYGLCTRLMDWTYNPLVALFFAVEKETDTDSCVYITWNYRLITNMNTNPFNINEKINNSRYHIYRPTYFIQRIIAQSSIFSVHGLNKHEPNTNNIFKIIIKNNYRKELKNTIIKYGINYRTLYPDLEGLCKDLFWVETNNDRHNAGQDITVNTSTSTP